MCLCVVCIHLWCVCVCVCVRVCVCVCVCVRMYARTHLYCTLLCMCVRGGRKKMEKQFFGSTCVFCMCSRRLQCYSSCMYVQVTIPFCRSQGSCENSILSPPSCIPMSGAALVVHATSTTSYTPPCIQYTMYTDCHGMSRGPIFKGNGSPLPPGKRDKLSSIELLKYPFNRSQININ